MGRLLCAFKIEEQPEDDATEVGGGNRSGGPSDAEAELFNADVSPAGRRLRGARSLRRQLGEAFVLYFGIRFT